MQTMLDLLAIINLNLTPEVTDHRFVFILSWLSKKGATFYSNTQENTLNHESFYRDFCEKRRKWYASTSVTNRNWLSLEREAFIGLTVWINKFTLTHMEVVYTQYLNNKQQFYLSDENTLTQHWQQYSLDE